MDNMLNFGKEDLDIISNRTSLVLGKENVEKIYSKHICICGLGGVGSYVLEAIARLGVSNLTLIDSDVVDKTNINRQLVASLYTIGMKKVDVAKVHIETINPLAKVNTLDTYINENNIADVIPKDADYVIDAIDSIPAKIGIIKYCKENNIKVISCMGMGNRQDPLKIKVCDISKTTVCPLAKIIRKRLKEMNINKVKVVYSEEEAVKNNEGKIGSTPYVPSVAGLVIASEVVKDLISM